MPAQRDSTRPLTPRLLAPRRAACTSPSWPPTRSSSTRASCARPRRWRPTGIACASWAGRRPACPRRRSWRPACGSPAWTSTGASAAPCGRCPGARRLVSRLVGLDPEARVLPPDAPRGLDRLRHPLRRDAGDRRQRAPCRAVGGGGRGRGPGDGRLPRPVAHRAARRAQRRPAPGRSLRLRRGRLPHGGRPAGAHALAGPRGRASARARLGARRRGLPGRERPGGRPRGAPLGRAAADGPLELPAGLAPGPARSRCPPTASAPPPASSPSGPSSSTRAASPSTVASRSSSRRPPRRASWSWARPSSSWATDGWRRTSPRPWRPTPGASTCCPPSAPTTSCPGPPRPTSASWASRRAP